LNLPYLSKYGKFNLGFLLYWHMWHVVEENNTGDSPTFRPSNPAFRFIIEYYSSLRDFGPY